MMRWKELLEKKPHAWVKWGVIAACLCIVIAGFVNGVVAREDNALAM